MWAYLVSPRLSIDLLFVTRPARSPCSDFHLTFHLTLFRGEKGGWLQHLVLLCSLKRSPHQCCQLCNSVAIFSDFLDPVCDKCGDFPDYWGRHGKPPGDKGCNVFVLAKCSLRLTYIKNRTLTLCSINEI